MGLRSAATAVAGSICCRMFDDADAVGARLGYPGLALAPEHLAHVCARATARHALEPFFSRTEAPARVTRQTCKPHLVIGIAPHGIGARLLARQPPLLPGLSRGIIDAHVARVPFADPQA